MFDNYELGGHRNEWYQNEIYMDFSLFEAFGAFDLNIFSDLCP